MKNIQIQELKKSLRDTPQIIILTIHLLVKKIMRRK